MLLPDCGGAIEMIAIAIPPKYFDDRDPANPQCLNAFGSLARSMMAGTTLVVVTEVGAAKTITQWGNRLDLSCQLQVANVVPDFGMEDKSIWI